MKQWLAETHGVKFELTRHFLARMFDSELFASRGEWQTVAVSAVAAILPVGMMFGNYATKYRRLAHLSSPVPFRSAAVADELSLLTLLMAVSGLIALLQWQALFPSKRDYFALAALPIRSRQIFAARFAAVAIFVSGVVLLINLPLGMVVPPQMMGHWAKNPSLAANIGAHTVAACLGCWFVFLAAMALQGTLLHLLPRKLFARLSVYVQGIGMAVCFLAALFSWTISSWDPAMVARLPEFGRWLPPVWFVGLHEALLGDRDVFFQAMKSRAWLALALTAVVTGLTYLAGYARYRKLLIDAPDDGLARRHRRVSLLRLIAPDPRGEAVLQFMAKTLARSRVHRVLLLAYIGVAIGLVLNSLLLTRSAVHALRVWWYEALQFVVLFWPMMLTAVILPGFRHVASLPAELSANWIFQSTESMGREQWMKSVERFVLVCLIGPIYLVLAPVSISVLGWGLALRMLTLQLLASLTMFEVIFGNWQQLPFACSYRPGKRPVMAIMARSLAFVGALVPLLSLVIRAASYFPQTFAVYLPIFGAIWIWTRRRRLEGWGENPLIYIDVEPVPGLGIGDLTFRPSETGGDEDSGPEPPPGGSGSGGSGGVRSRRPVAVSLRLYRTLAESFPQEFRNAYGDELLHVTEDAIEPIWRRHGMAGLVRLLLDIAVRVPVEYAAEFRRDFRFGLRTLAQSPGYTLVALVSLSIGLCIAICSFSELNGFVLRNLPGVAAPDELVAMPLPISYPDYERYRDHADSFRATAAYIAPVPFTLSVGGRKERTWGHLVTSSYFSTFGVQPAMGRFFDTNNDTPGRAPQVAVSYRFWQNQLGGDPSIVGKTLDVNGHPATVVAVGPKDFLGASPAVFAADLWLPISVGANVAPEISGGALERRDRPMFRLVGRLKPGVTTGAAEAQMDAIARVIARDNGERETADNARRVQLAMGGKVFAIRKQDLPFFTEFMILLGGLVLMIACSNLANMAMARAGDRRKEIAVRLALGASRARLVRQLLTEHMVVAVAAGAIGFALSAWLMHQLANNYKMPFPMATSWDLTPDGRVLLFSFALVVFAAVGFGLLPALQSTRLDLTPALKEGRHVQFRRYRRLSLRNLLLLAQMAGSLMLLLLTGYMSLGIQNSLGVQAGFDASNLYLVSLDPIRDGRTPQQSALLLQQVLDRVQRLQGVTAACLSDTTPVSISGNSGVRVSAGGTNRKLFGASKFMVGKDYFQTAGIPVLLGRSFRQEDEADDSNSIVVTQEMVAEFWHGENPVGRTIEISQAPASGGKGVWPGSFDYRAGAVGRQRVFQVVGVAGDIAEGVVVRSKPLPGIYFPLRRADFAQPSLQGVTLIVRSTPGTDTPGAVRREVAAIDDHLTLFNGRSMHEQIEDFTSALRAPAWTYRLIGVFGLILAAVGLAGVTAYSVAQRTHEIGIRMALGARAADVLGLVMREGASIVLTGTVSGLLLAWAAFRAASSFFWSVSSIHDHDPRLTFGAPLLLVTLALLACYLPARRSTRVDPMIALRTE